VKFLDFNRHFETTSQSTFAKIVVITVIAVYYWFSRRLKSGVIFLFQLGDRASIQVKNDQQGEMRPVYDVAHR